MTLVDFNELNWHDSEIIEIRVYKDEQEQDCVDVVLDYIEDYEPLASCRWLARFVGCYYVGMRLNRGIIAPESILTADVSDDSELRREVVQRFGEMRGPHDLVKHYRFETSTTGSIVQILAGQFFFE